MVSTLLTLAVALLALAFAYALLRNAHTGIRDDRDWEEKRHRIDVEIFRVLLDRNEEAELRRFLPPDQFAAFQRRRIRLALHMIRLVDDNAGMLMELVRLAKRKDDPAQAQQVDELIASAFQLRINLLVAKLCLLLKWIFPSWTISLPAFDARYQHLLDSVQASGRAIA